MQSTDFPGVVSPVGAGVLSHLFAPRQRFDEGGPVGGDDGQGGEQQAGSTTSSPAGGGGAPSGGGMPASLDLGGNTLSGAMTNIGGVAAPGALSGLGSITGGGSNGMANDPWGRRMAGITASGLQGLLGMAVPGLGPALTIANLASMGLTGKSLVSNLMDHGTNDSAPVGTMAPGTEIGQPVGALNTSAADNLAQTPPDNTSPTSTPGSGALSQAPSPWLQQSLYGVQGSNQPNWSAQTNVPLGG